MKAGLFSEGYGIIVGRLTSPTTVSFTTSKDGGLIRKIFNLTGHVVETEYNDVIILGQQLDNDTFEVFVMESLLAYDKIKVYQMPYNENKLLAGIVIPQEKVKNIKTGYASTTAPYTELIVDGGKNIILHLKTYNEFQTPDNNMPYVFLTTKPFEKNQNTFGEGFSKITKTTMYCNNARQLLS